MTRGRPLRRDPEFLKFWVGETIGFFGGSVSGVAFPLTAVLVLGAGALEMGILSALGTLPFLLVGLLAGVLVDRTRRRPVLVGAYLGFALLLATIPAAAVLGWLRIELLYVIAFLTGALGVVAPVAYQAFMPSLVGRARLVEANSAIEMSGSATRIVGPSIGGFLVQVFTAPIVILVDAVALLLSSLLLALVRVSEPPPAPRHERPPIWSEMREGLDLIIGDRHLRSIMLCGVTHNVFSNGMLIALYVLFATETLRLSPAELGVVLAAGGPGSLLGSFLAARLSRAGGLGPTLAAMQVLTGLARLALPFALVLGPPALLLAVGEFLLGIARTVFNVNQVSLRQSITPDHQLGRMNASIRFLMWAVVPFGALLGGWLGETIGLLSTVWIGAVGTLLASLWIFLSPVWSLREGPEPVAA